MRRVLFVISLLMILLAACAPVAATQQPGSDEPATPSEAPADETPAERAAVTALSEQLGLPANEIKVVSTEAVTWPDGCLGVVRIGVMCTQAQVPGFRIMLEADGESYEFHTNQNGTIALPAEAGGVSELAVIKQLVANLGLKESDISVVSSEPVEFGDACLGVAMEGVACAQVVTPGRIIVLEAKGVQYAYHTSEDGSRVQPATVAMVWKREGGIAGFCDSLTVFRSGEVYSNSCKPQQEGKMGILAKLLSAQEQKQFNDWMSKFGEANLDASDPAGVADRMVVTLSIFGSGDKPPTKAEQEQLFGFAQDLFTELAQ